mmetsp:Transcript_56305/g.182857  ORF Transcript_56305/g.182857 Transcript_56305/m.182857 type:complete len:248 (+) Transcript_56305:66-809(+)
MAPSQSNSMLGLLVGVLALAGYFAADDFFVVPSGSTTRLREGVRGALALRSGFAVPRGGVAGSAGTLAGTTAIASAAALVGASAALSGRARQLHVQKPTTAVASGGSWAAPVPLSGAAPVEPPAPPAFDPRQQVGALAPLGYFDPLGFSTGGDEYGYIKLREAELKHGRLAMIASLGLVVQHFVRLPGSDNAPDGLRSLNCDTGLLFFSFFSGILELVWRSDERWAPHTLPFSSARTCTPLICATRG